MADDYCKLGLGRALIRSDGSGRSGTSCFRWPFERRTERQQCSKTCATRQGYAPTEFAKPAVPHLQFLALRVGSLLFGQQPVARLPFWLPIPIGQQVVAQFQRPTTKTEPTAACTSNFGTKSLLLTGMPHANHG